MFNYDSISMLITSWFYSLANGEVQIVFVGYIQLIIMLVLMIISYAIQVSNIPDPVDAAEGSLDVPTAEEGSSIPVVFGEVLVKNPNVIWSGDASTTAIRSKGGKK